MIALILYCTFLMLYAKGYLYLFFCFARDHASQVRKKSYHSYYDSFQDSHDELEESV